MRYKTFIRSANGWQDFAKARKITVNYNLSIEEAASICKHYNENRNSRQIKKGTRMEFTAQ